MAVRDVSDVEDVWPQLSSLQVYSWTEWSGINLRNAAGAWGDVHDGRRLQTSGAANITTANEDRGLPAGQGRREGRNEGREGLPRLMRIEVSLLTREGGREGMRGGRDYHG